jgi:hypothetical protein
VKQHDAGTYQLMGGPRGSYTHYGAWFDAAEDSRLLGLLSATVGDFDSWVTECIG